MSEPYFPRHANSPIEVAPKWKCGECKAEFPPHEEGGLFEHMRTHLAAVATEHCKVCDGDGRLLAGNSVWPCTNCRNGRRTRPASSPESGVGIGPEEEPWSQPLLKATLARVAVEKEAAQLRERLATAERERDAALGLLLMHHDTHDQGHSPCACAWSQTFLAASKGGGK